VSDRPIVFATHHSVRSEAEHPDFRIGAAGNEERVVPVGNIFNIGREFDGGYNIIRRTVNAIRSGIDFMYLPAPAIIGDVEKVIGRVDRNSSRLKRIIVPFAGQGFSARRTSVSRASGNQCA
jgi:hypothetical protein